jgi:hypothetical protein
MSMFEKLTTVILVCLTLFALSAGSCRAAASEDALYKQYTDPQRRFILDYPATMRIRSSGPGELQFSHPGATFRISVFIENRKSKADRKAEDLLNAFKRELEKEMQEVSVLGQGKLPGLGGSQGYVMVSFKDKKGKKLVQLVQYYVTENRILQLIISDRPEGFKNLEPVIRRVHHSLRIIDPKLN